MKKDKQTIAEILQTCAETHHAVYLKEDGADPDWATWYAAWLTQHSELPEALDTDIVPSELTYLLVKSDKEYTKDQPAQSWQEYYADKILGHFSTSKVNGNRR